MVERACVKRLQKELRAICKEPPYKLWRDLLLIFLTGIRFCN